MAKKDISKFQKALLSKTKVIKNDIAASVSESIKTAALKEFKLDKATVTKYEALAKKHNIDSADLMNYGLKFFLKFEDELFD